MNIVMVCGRLTKDPDIKYIASTQTAVASFSIAIDRPLSKDKEKKVDFFNILVFGKMAENCEKYLKKGRLVNIKGRLQNNNFKDKEGIMRYNTEIVCEQVQFIDWGKDGKSGESKEYKPRDYSKDQLPEGFSLDEDEDGDIPF